MWSRGLWQPNCKCLKKIHVWSPNSPQAAGYDLGGSGQLPSQLPPLDSGHHHEDTNAPPSVHPIHPSAPNLCTHHQPQQTGASYKSMPGLHLLWHADPEQPHPNLNSTLRPLLPDLQGWNHCGPPGLLIVVQWSVTVQTIGRSLVLPKSLGSVTNQQQQSTPPHCPKG